MSDPHVEADGDTAPGGRASVPASAQLSLATRAAFGFGLGLLAVLLVTSARSAPPVGARLGHRVDLVELIQAEEARTQALAAQVEELSRQVVAVQREAGQDTEAIANVQDRVDELLAPAGMTAVRGSGVVVELMDSRVTPPPDADLNDYVIHEQDLQAVINALWAGGAEAMAVNGNRILSTTAIRCVGNVLLLHGATHSPPYVVEAIGDPVALGDALARDPAVERFERAVLQFQLGFDRDVARDVVVPAFEGASAMQVARPAEGQA